MGENQGNNPGGRPRYPTPYHDMRSIPPMSDMEQQQHFGISTAMYQNAPRPVLLQAPTGGVNPEQLRAVEVNVAADMTRVLRNQTEILANQRVILGNQDRMEQRLIGLEQGLITNKNALVDLQRNMAVMRQGSIMRSDPIRGSGSRGIMDWGS